MWAYDLSAIDCTVPYRGNGHLPPSLSSSMYFDSTSLHRPRSESIAS